MPRVAALLDLSQISDIIRIENEDTFYSTNFMQVMHLQLYNQQIVKK